MALFIRDRNPPSELERELRRSSKPPNSLPRLSLVPSSLIKADSLEIWESVSCLRFSASGAAVVLPVVEGKSVDSVAVDDAVDVDGVNDAVVMAGQESAFIAAPVAENDSSRKQYSSSSGSSRSLL